MGAIVIRAVGPDDVVRLNAALSALSDDLGDTHRASDGDLARAAFGPIPSVHALLAELGDEVVGAALYSPLYSTTRGMAGAYVSDLWVGAAARGQGLGPQLLAAVRDRAKAQWDAGFLRLAVYHDNSGARRFYDRLGFALMEGDHWLTLSGPALENLGENG